MMNTSRILVTGCGFMLTALALVGCAISADETAASGVQSTSPNMTAKSAGTTDLPMAPSAVVEKNLTKWTLPTDPYKVGEYAVSLQEQADSMLTASCMHGAGFPQYVEYWDASAPMPENLAGNGVSLNFNEASAAKYGYRIAPDPRYLIESLIPADGGLYDNEPQAFHDQWDLCTIQSKEEVMGMDFEEVPDPASDVMQDDTGSVGSQLNQLQVDWNAPELQEAASLWRTCMAPKGIVDLPDHPWVESSGMPESLIALWGRNVYGTPSADEVSMAVFDAACRESSGWFEVYYEAEWNTAEAFVNENKAELAPILAQYQADADRALAVIQKYSG